MELSLDVRDRVAASIIDTRSGEGSTVRFYNAAEEEFMKVGVGKLYKPLFDEELVGVRHAEDGMLYAILRTSDGGATYDKPVGALPFATVQVGPNCEFGLRISAVSLVTATRPYTDELL